MKTWISAALLTASVAFGGTMASTGASVAQPSQKASFDKQTAMTDLSANRRHHHSHRHHMHRRHHFRDAYGYSGYQPPYYGGSFGGFRPGYGYGGGFGHGHHGGHGHGWHGGHGGHGHGGHGHR